MSCEHGLKRASTAGLRCGLDAVRSRAVHALGRAAANYMRLAATPNGAALRVIESFDGPASLNSLVAAATGVEAALWLKNRSQAEEEQALLARLYLATPGEKLPPGMPSKNRQQGAPQSAPNPPEWWLTQGRSGQASGEEATAVPAWLGQGAMTRRRDRASLEGKRFFEPGGDRPPRTAANARQTVLLALGVLKLGNAAGNFTGTGLARLSQKEDTFEQRLFFPHSRRLNVATWQSRLTPLLNRLDRGPGRIKQSDGLMFEMGGKSWHRGAVVIETVGGERTLTHLQSLTAPATHYYFNRRLTDTEAVGIVSGQRGFEPKYLDGYVGQVSEVESLSPRWAMVKKNLIRTRLRWGGDPDAAASRSETEQPAAEQARPGKRPTPAPAAVPLAQVGDRVRLADGQEYPVIVRRVRAGRAEAIWYDEANAVWKEVREPAARRRLARQVEAGRLEVWDHNEGGQSSVRRD